MRYRHYATLTKEIDEALDLIVRNLIAKERLDRTAEADFRFARLSITAWTLSGIAFALKILARGIPAIEVERWQRIFRALTCLIRGSKAASFEMT